MKKLFVLMIFALMGTARAETAYQQHMDRWMETENCFQQNMYLGKSLYEINQSCSSQISQVMQDCVTYLTKNASIAAPDTPVKECLIGLAAAEQSWAGY